MTLPVRKTAASTSSTADTVSEHPCKAFQRCSADLRYPDSHATSQASMTGRAARPVMLSRLSLAAPLWNRP